MMSQSVITTHYLQEDSSGWVMFRPSLSDPLRPAATLVTRNRPLSTEVLYCTVLYCTVGGHQAPAP